MISKPSITITKSDKFPVRKYRTQEDIQEHKFSEIFKHVLNSPSEWRESFQFIDRYNRGWVSSEDLRLILERHEAPVSDSMLAELCQTFAADGCFRYYNFLEEMRKLFPELEEMGLPRLRQKLREELETRKISPTMMFLQFDTNNNGIISDEELIAYYRNLGIHLQIGEVRALISKFSSDQRGLNYKAFSEMLLGKMEQSQDDVALADMANLLLSKQDDLKHFLEETDANKEGVLNEQDFAEGVLTCVSFMNLEEAKTLYRILNRSKQKLNYRRIGILLDSVQIGSLSGEARRIFNDFKEEFFDQSVTVRAELEQADADRDGLLNFQELVTAVQRMGVFLEETQLRPIFTSLDRKSTGKISINEFMSTMQSKIWK